MHRLGTMALLVALISMAAGCSMCCSPYDNDYAAHGGVRPRGDMQYGRVGSVFAPADEQIVEASAIEGDQEYYDYAPVPAP